MFFAMFICLYFFLHFYRFSNFMFLNRFLENSFYALFAVSFVALFLLCLPKSLSTPNCPGQKHTAWAAVAGLERGRYARRIGARRRGRRLGRQGRHRRLRRLRLLISGGGRLLICGGRSCRRRRRTGRRLLVAGGRLTPRARLALAHQHHVAPEAIRLLLNTHTQSGFDFDKKYSVYILIFS